MGDSQADDYEGPLQVAAGTAGNHRFGALLKSLRERGGLSPQQLAEQANVHVSFVRGIERGAQAPSVATARLLLACVTEQDRIRWRDSGPYDLLIRDPETDRDVAFEFKAKLKGQNRRTDKAFGELSAADLAILKKVEDRSAGSLIAAATVLLPRLQAMEQFTSARMANLAEGMSRLFPETGEPSVDGAEVQPRSSAPADDTRFGRVVRLLALVDDELLERVERLLHDELGPKASGPPPADSRTVRHVHKWQP